MSRFTSLQAFNQTNPRSAEAALKYFLFGGMAAAFTLFGMSLLYGISHSTNLADVARMAVAHGVKLARFRGENETNIGSPPGAGIVMTIIGFGFKMAAAPFHLWAPDVYQAAPIPSAALIASGSKVAGFFVLAKVMMVGFAGIEGSRSAYPIVRRVGFRFWRRLPRPPSCWGTWPLSHRIACGDCWLIPPSRMPGTSCWA